MQMLFTHETKSFTTSLCACKSKKGNLYFKVYRSNRETFYTEESVVYHTLEEALATYIDWCR